MPAPNPAGLISSPFRGEVVSLTADTVSVKQVVADKSITCTIDFTVPAEAKVLREGKPVSLTDIKKGDSLAVTFSLKFGQPGVVVTQVEVCKPCGK